MIDLYTAATPNGWMVAIALEELGQSYTVHALDRARHEPDLPWFRALSPTGRLPLIVDRGRGDLAVFEPAAILLYLAERAGRLLPADPAGRSRAVQWLCLQTAALAPAMAQADHYTHEAPTPQPYAAARAQSESRRLYEALDQRLAGSEYLAGHDYSIADIAHWCWVGCHARAGVTLERLPALRRWQERIAQRPAVQRGRQVPM